jgi:hypothetical protein
LIERWLSKNCGLCPAQVNESLVQELLLAGCTPAAAGASERSEALFVQADHFGNCSVCGAYLDMRDLNELVVHMHDLESAKDQSRRAKAFALDLNAKPASKSSRNL